MPVDKGLYDELKSCLWYDPKQEEYVHRTEHSLEFQALWLKYLWREKTPAWVPMLCSAFERFSPDKPPTGLAAVEGAIKAMREKLSARVQSGQKIMILAGVDMSHVGVRFGSDGNIDTDAKAKVEKEDKLSLDYALNIDADGFYSSVASDGNKRNVCGLSALYTALRLMKGAGGQVQSKGSLLSYQQAQDPLGGIVSFASAIYKN